LEHPAFPQGSIIKTVKIIGDRITEVDPGDRSNKNPALDQNGHGTHCAGIIGARPLVWHEDRWVAYEPGLSNQKRPADAAELTQMPMGEPRRQTGWDGQSSMDSEIFWNPVHRGHSQVEATAQRRFRDLTVRFSGVAPAAELMIYKVTEGDSRTANLNDVALAINQATDAGADIISISIQGDQGTNALFFAVHRALSKRRMIITSAGNRGRLRQVNIGWPARYGGVITVAAHNGFGQPSAFTSAGGEIDFSAPGERMWSTWIDSSYVAQSGTSMAAPWVAGCAALILSKHRQSSGRNETPVRNNEELREHLVRMAAHQGHYDPKEGYGALWIGNYFERATISI
jgi:subtilisin family serine protease